MTRAPSRRVASEPRPGRGVAFPEGSRHGATRGVTCAQDPSRMTPAARLAELGEILAAGYRRGRKALAESAEPEALCEPAVDGNGAEAAEEVA